MAILSWLDNPAQVDQIEFRNYDVIRVRVRLAKFNVVCSFYMIQQPFCSKYMMRVATQV